MEAPTVEDAIAASNANIEAAIDQTTSAQEAAIAQLKAENEALKKSGSDQLIASLMAENAALRSRRNIASPEVPGVQHTVQTGDTLDSIAAQHGSSATLVYGANSTIIEAKAGARGFPDSEGGRLLFPGTVLKVPQV
jgi:hypothetical protein